MKIIGTIVGHNLALIGVTVKGKSYEFGGFDSTEVQTELRIMDLIQKKFKNSQIDCSSGQVVELKNFKLNKLPMLMWKQNEIT